jgi:hypothetical protein
MRCPSRGPLVCRHVYHCGRRRVAVVRAPTMMAWNMMGNGGVVWLLGRGITSSTRGRPYIPVLEPLLQETMSSSKHRPYLVPEDAPSKGAGSVGQG